jgi:hypothetical protein
MAIECPDCRTVTGNDNATHCVACGRKFYKLKPRSNDDLHWLGVSLLIGVLLTVFVVQRRC